MTSFPNRSIASSNELLILDTSLLSKFNRSPKKGTIYHCEKTIEKQNGAKLKITIRETFKASKYCLCTEHGIGKLCFPNWIWREQKEKGEKRRLENNKKENTNVKGKKCKKENDKNLHCLHDI